MGKRPKRRKTPLGNSAREFYRENKYLREIYFLLNLSLPSHVCPGQQL